MQYAQIIANPLAAGTDGGFLHLRLFLAHPTDDRQMIRLQRIVHSAVSDAPLQRCLRAEQNVVHPPTGPARDLGPGDLHQGKGINRHYCTR
jgi:hypothetical protein